MRAVATEPTMAAAVDTVFEYVMINYRWVFVCLFLLPCTVLGKLWSVWEMRTGAVYTDGDRHRENVKKIQRRIRLRNEKDPNRMMCTAKPSWKSVSLADILYKKHMHNVDVHLDAIIAIDTESQTVRVEPGITFGRLVPALIQSGWTLPIVVDLKELTVGGLVMGTGLESSSHKYGLFYELCTRYELITCDGNVMTCSKTENAQAFECLPCSYGTLGFLTAVDLKIMPAKKYVALEYSPVVGPAERMESALRLEVNGNNEFVELIVFSQSHGVLVTGRLTDGEDNTATTVNEIGRFYKPWFFKHVQTFLEADRHAEELVPLADYYFRHNNSLFWEIQDIIPFGNNAVFRYFLGWLMPPKIALLKLTQTAIVKRLYDKYHFVDDFILPLSGLAESLGQFHRTLNIYPIWVCPVVLRSGRGLMHSPSAQDEMYVDVGLYGEPKVSGYNCKATGTRLEHFVLKLKGFKMLYTGTHLTSDEFKSMFDHGLYDKIRRQLRCEFNLPEIYNKVNKSARK
ncbi:delta(24)-sterol reductase-like [Adelges cooleyi]|uniref:delta(24)-sterol reductase-like n=1 Tax=Adelges cooleyi TaxID=133065 RepID=UPI00217F7A32|nr:delta(24)-sterol reductase-like [Adelges cooleyi]